MLILLVVLFFMVLLEGTITTLPIALSLLVVIATRAERTTVLGIAFASGIFLDILRVRTVGQTSLLLVTFLFLIFLYEKKYEINTLPFVTVATFVGTVLYGFILGLPFVLVSAFITTSVAAVLFLLMTRFSLQPGKSRLTVL